MKHLLRVIILNIKLMQSVHDPNQLVPISKSILKASRIVCLSILFWNSTNYSFVKLVNTDQLIHHALQAIRGCLQGDQELTSDNVAVAIVGVDQPFTILEGNQLQPYIDAVEVADTKDDDGDTKMDE